MDPFWTKIAKTHLEGEFAYEIDSKFAKSAGPAAENLESPIEMDRKPLPTERILQKNDQNPNERTDERTNEETLGPDPAPPPYAHPGAEYAPFGEGRCPPASLQYTGQTFVWKNTPDSVDN